MRQAMWLPLPTLFEDVRWRFYIRNGLNSQPPASPHNLRHIAMRSEDQIEEILACVLTRLLECWSLTGFGETTIASERYSADKVRVIVKGSVHQQFYVTVEEVARRLNEERARQDTVEMAGR